MSGFRYWLLCLLLIGGVRAETPLPASPEPYYIRDDAKWLTPGAFTALNEKLKAFERETSSQFVVAIFPGIPEGAELFDFSQRLFNFWKVVGTEKKNGALFLVFVEDRKMRIQVGRGMEGVLPDARCKQIIEDVVAPQIRAGNREAAINAGVDAMISASMGEYKGNGTTRLDGTSDHFDVPWIFIIFALFIIFHIINAGRRAILYGAGGWSYTAGSTLGKDRKSTRLNSSHPSISRMPSSA